MVQCLAFVDQIWISIMMVAITGFVETNSIDNSVSQFGRGL
jgi:hypothetical protein